MSEPELVDVHEVAKPRLAPVEFVGRVARYEWGRYYVDGDVRAGDVLLARWEPHGCWRTGRAVAYDDSGVVRVDLAQIVAIAEHDYVYRIGKPTTPSLEERVAELERRVYRDLIVADDAEKSGRPDIAEKLRKNVDWWRDPEIDWTGIER